MANRNQEASKQFSKGFPVVAGKVSHAGVNDELVKAVVAEVLAKLRSGSSDPELHRTADLATGSTSIVPLSASVSPVPYITRLGSSPMLVPQQTRIFGKSESHVVRGLRSAHQRWHVEKNHVAPTCQFCQADTMAKVDNHVRELQQGQE